MINPMMLPPDQWGSGEPTPPYDVPRGTCPRCGSTQVVHLVIGMPVRREDWVTGPEWIRGVGCSHPGDNWTCDDCGHAWEGPSDFEVGD